MQDHDHPGVDWTPLWQAFVESATEWVPMIVGAIATLILAVLGRYVFLVNAVKREAILAERDIGRGSGKHKHKRVKNRIKETWPMSRVSVINSLIKTRGKPAADKDRELRESQIPPPPSESN